MEKVRERIKIMNKPMIKKLIDYLEGIPEKRIDMHSWIEKKKGCGTAGCIAGHTVLMAGLKPHPYGWQKEDYDNGLSISINSCKNGGIWYISDKAAEILGLTEKQQDKIFRPNNWPPKFIQRYEDGEVKQSTIDRLKYFLKTGK